MTFRGSHLYVNGPEIQHVFGVTSLPLTTVAHIISYLDDDVTSLSRLCRTSASLYYMTLPHLWKSVTLTSHPSIRYKDGEPEGSGGASPFSMGLNALVTTKVAPLVRNLILQGDFGWMEPHEYSRAGRVSETGMVLNIAICAALDRCPQLESFRWDLNTRIQPNVYSSLARLPKLRELWLRFPSSRAPHPITVIPPMPTIETLYITHFDPLCNPDDLSTFFFHAEKLRTLQMHFSPRMRDAGEASVIVAQFFRKNIIEKKKLFLKRVGMYNLFAQMDVNDCLHAVDTGLCDDFTALNCFGPDESPFKSSSNATWFLDKTWLIPSDKVLPKPKVLRLDQLHKRHTHDLARASGLERLYLVNARHVPRNSGHAVTPSSRDQSPLIAPATCNGGTDAAANSIRNTTSIHLRDLYMDSICDVCGPTLKHLILPARWPLSQEMIVRLIRSAPNLTQLSAPIICSGFDFFRLVVPFLTHLWALRILAPATEGLEGERLACEFRQFVDQLDEESFEECQVGENGPFRITHSGMEKAAVDVPHIRYVGFGDKVFEIGQVYEDVVKTPVALSSRDGSGGDSGIVDDHVEYSQEVVRKRRVTRIPESDVAHVEIWKMDSLDVI
ncbi:hypothetical protein PV10_04735 [Exophiala mesophila]|uniref:F-box domain-containing protein n=1 Tax=Exophiala mesophila TaxID=212818 RepID=A0A0D1WW06_EXOME|nr:uncharacterized protein PV10_04735 [Exophiala mesophila]KIV93525.1 hypothetical protein PV10_04735 [Exophiala mesophila]